MFELFSGLYFFSSDFRIKRGGPWVIPVRGQQLSWETPDHSGAGQDENTHSRGGLRRLRASCKLRPVLGRLPRYIPRLNHNLLRICFHLMFSFLFFLRTKYNLESMTYLHTSVKFCSLWFGCDVNVKTETKYKSIANNLHKVNILIWDVMFVSQIEFSRENENILTAHLLGIFLKKQIIKVGTKLSRSGYSTLLEEGTSILKIWKVPLAQENRSWGEPHDRFAADWLL